MMMDSIVNVYIPHRYVFIGNTVASPALLSLSTKWAKATWAIALPNFLMYVFLPRSTYHLMKQLLMAYLHYSGGGLYAHTAAKLIFVRVFRHTRHIYTHTLLGWTVWAVLCFAAVGLAFLFVVAIPIFSYLIGISAALFASWYTYGIAGFFWIHDTKNVNGGLSRRPVMFILSMLTILAGAFICVAGTFVSVKVSRALKQRFIPLNPPQLIIAAHESGIIGKPFTC